MSRETFDHERLIVYQKALGFVPVASGYVASWPKTLAVTDHFSRATESIVVNLAEAVSQRTSDSKTAGTDCALGSVLECAACLDVAHILGLLPENETLSMKGHLAEIARMLVGLRKSWRREVREEEGEYRTGSGNPVVGVLFSHERLDVYRVALDFVRWFRAQHDVTAGLRGHHRQVDGAMTSMVLNVAEGNGRFSVMDHRRFLGIAERAAVKAAAYLDIAVAEHDFDANAVAEGKVLLVRVVSMLAGMVAPGDPGE